MKDRGRKKSGGRIAVVAVIIAVLSCGLLIALNMLKVAEEKKFEQRFPEEKTLAKPPPAFPPLQPRLINSAVYCCDRSPNSPRSRHPRKYSAVKNSIYY